jgi:predicted phage terminase large subunit-like protein
MIAGFGSSSDGGWSNRFDDGIKMMATRPDDALLELDRADCQTLKGFTRVFWPIIEPGRELVEGWVLDALDDHLTAVSRGQIRKILINVPPGCMKSLKVNVLWPAFEWGPMKMPWLRYVCASYSQDLTVRDNRRARMIIDSPRYRQLYGPEAPESYEKWRVELSSDQDAKVKFENTKRGWKIATSVGGAVVGERGDRFIIDDPHNIKVVESDKIREATLQWFTEVVPTRVNDPDKAVFVVIMQRVHERDISGLILAKELGYEHLCLPMEWESDHPHRSRSSIHFVDPREKDGKDGALLWPERFSARYLEELKEQLRSWGGGYAEAGQLQQRPTPRGGGMFARSLWRFFKSGIGGYEAAARPHGCDMSPAEPRPAQFDSVFMSVDCAFKSTEAGSRVSCLVIGTRGPFRYILDNDTRAMTFTETCQAIAQFDPRGKLIGGLMHRWNCMYAIVEDKANGPAVIDTLRQNLAGLIPVNPEGGKEARAAAMEPTLRSGHVLLPEGAPWLEDFISEHASFPVGMRDDQVDALSQAIIYLVNNEDISRAIAMSRT